MLTKVCKEKYNPVRNNNFICPSHKILINDLQDFVFDQSHGDAVRADAHQARRQRDEQRRRRQQQDRHRKHLQKRFDSRSLILSDFLTFMSF